MKLWKARLQVRLCERVLAEMDNPDDPDALTLYRNAVGTLWQVQKRLRESRTCQTREEAAPANSPYLTAREAAGYLRVAYSTFRKCAVRIKRCPQTGKYLRADLDAYAEAFRPKRKR